MLRLLMLAIAALATGAGAGPPNIVLIVADDLGYADLGCYGQRTIATPRLDRMAAEGIRFTQHYAGSTVCAPSRCSLMTGLTTGHCLIRGNADIDLRPGDVTIAELLQGAGYATALIGKWGLGSERGTGHPLDQGFDHFFGYLDQVHAHNAYPEFLIRGRERAAMPNEVPENPAWKRGQGLASTRTAHSHELIIEEARRWMREQAGREEPFFLCLALTIPHANNEAGRIEPPEPGPYADEPWPEAERAFAAMMHVMDRDTGALLDLLDELAIAEETLVLFTSDNGPHAEGGHDPDFFDSSGPFRGIKRDLYEGGIRVPLIARWPGVIAPGAVSGHVSAFWDLLPTVCDLAGISTPSGTDGVSFAPSLLGRAEAQAEHASLYWEFFEQGGKQAVRFGDLKAIRLDVRRDPDGPIMLFDLAEDPGETRDLASRRPADAERARRLMDSSRSASEHFGF